MFLPFLLHSLIQWVNLPKVIMYLLMIELDRTIKLTLTNSIFRKSIRLIMQNKNRFNSKIQQNNIFYIIYNKKPNAQFYDYIFSFYTWRFVWSVKWSERENARPQCLQRNGFTPVCLLKIELYNWWFFDRNYLPKMSC